MPGLSIHDVRALWDMCTMCRPVGDVVALDRSSANVVTVEDLLGACRTKKLQGILADRVCRVLIRTEASMSLAVYFRFHEWTTARLSTCRTTSLFLSSLGYANAGSKSPIDSRVVDLEPNATPFESVALSRLSGHHILIDGSP